MKNYENSRSHIPADIERQIKTEAGHMCTVQHCYEVIAEMHHIDGNRDNNAPENLIYICHKHHKMAHRGEIRRKDLIEYKRLNRLNSQCDVPLHNNEHDHDLLNKFSKLFPHELICAIQQEPFERRVRRELISPFDDLLNNVKDPLWHFVNPELENIRLALINKAELFTSHFDNQCGSSKNPDYFDYIDPLKCVSGSPDYWRKYSMRTCILDRVHTIESIVIANRINPANMISNLS